MKNIHWCPHKVHSPKRHKSYQFWTLHFVPGYKSLWISKSFLQVTLNNIAQKWCPAARQGPIYKPTRSKLNPKCSYNSTGAFWWAYHPMLLLVGFQRINRPGNHITGCWLSSLGECTRRMMWGRSDRDTGVYGESPPPTPLRLPRVWCVPLNWHWKDREGAWPRSTPERRSLWTHRVVSLWLPFMTSLVIVNRKGVVQTDMQAHLALSGAVLEEELRSFTWVKVTIPQCRNTTLQAKVLHLKVYLSQSGTGLLVKH